MRINIFKISAILILSVFWAVNANAASVAGKVYIDAEGLYVNAGSNVIKYISLHNNLDKRIDKVSINVSSPSMYVNVSESGFSVGPGGVRSVGISMTTDEDAQKETAVVMYDISYSIDGETDAFSVSDSFNVRISQTNSQTTPDPNRAPVLVMTAPTSVINMKAGTSAEIELVFKNTGNYRAANVLVLPEPSPDLSFSFKDGANAVSTLAVGSEIKMKLIISTDKDTKTGSYPAKMNIYYFDLEKKQQTAGAIFHVKVEKEEEKEEEEKVAKPNLTMKNIEIMPDTVKAGDGFTVTAVIENTSKDLAENVLVSISSLNSEAIGIPNSASDSYFASVAANDTRTVSYNFTSYETAKTGSYPIKFKVVYKDEDFKDYSGEYTYYVWITEKEAEEKPPNEDRAVINVSDINVPTGTFDTAQKFPISFNLVNRGKFEAKNIVVSAECPDGIVPNSANKVQAAALAPNESKPISFMFSSVASSVTQNYTIGFTIEYETGVTTEDEEGVVTSKEKDSFTQFIGINIVNSKADERARKEEEEKNKPTEKPEDEEKNKSIPKIIVSKYRTDPLIVQAGQEFDLFMTFQNTHRVKSVENIKALLTVPLNSDGNKSANVFSPVNSSNTFYIDSISPKAVSDQYIRLFTVPDAVAKNYVLVIDFEYEDADGNQIKTQSEVGVNVKQIAKLELGDIIIPTSANVNDQLYVDFSVQNTGKVNLNNLKIKLSGDAFDTSSGEIIYGNFESGSHDYYNAQFMPIEPGQQTLKMIVSYDEDTGEHVENVYEYEIFVNEMMDGGEMLMDGENGLDGMNGIDSEDAQSGFLGFIKQYLIWIIIGVLGLAVVIAVIVTVVVRSRKKRSQFNDDLM